VTTWALECPRLPRVSQKDFTHEFRRKTPHTSCAERIKFSNRDDLVFLHTSFDYGVATMSRLLKSIGLFCKRALPKRPIFFKETFNFEEPTNRSHAIQKETCCTHTTWSFYTQDTHFQVGDVSARSFFL